MVPPTQKSPGFLPEPTVYGLCALREVGPGGNAGDFQSCKEDSVGISGRLILCFVGLFHAWWDIKHP